MEVTPEVAPLQLPQQDSCGKSSHLPEAALCPCPSAQVLTGWGQEEQARLEIACSRMRGEMLFWSGLGGGQVSTLPAYKEGFCPLLPLPSQKGSSVLVEQDWDLDFRVSLFPVMLFLKPASK